MEHRGVCLRPIDTLCSIGDAQKDKRVVFVYVTLNTMAEGQRLAQLLIERQLTNCVNFHPITCTYLWEGKVTTEPEVVALIKTRAEHFDAIAEAVRATIPYTNFVGQLEVTRVNEAFAAWLDSIVQSSPAPVPPSG